MYGVGEQTGCGIGSQGLIRLRLVQLVGVEKPVSYFRRLGLGRLLGVELAWKAAEGLSHVETRMARMDPAEGITCKLVRIEKVEADLFAASYPFNISVAQHWYPLSCPGPAWVGLLARWRRASPTLVVDGESHSTLDAPDMRANSSLLEGADELGRGKRC